MAMATKRAMATGSNNLDGYIGEGCGRLTVASMGPAQRTQPLVLQLERGV